jgi:hypothetical protein
VTGAAAPAPRSASGAAAGAGAVLAADTSAGGVEPEQAPSSAALNANEVQEAATRKRRSDFIRTPLE